MNKLSYTIPFCILIIMLFVGLGITLYSEKTAEAFCKERDMVFFDLVQKNMWDTKDDVICWTKTDMARGYSDNVVAEEIKLYYFERD